MYIVRGYFNDGREWIDWYRTDSIEDAIETCACMRDDDRAAAMCETFEVVEA